MHSNFLSSVAQLGTASGLFVGSVLLAQSAPLDSGFAKLLESAAFAAFAFYLLAYSIPSITDKHEKAVNRVAASLDTCVSESREAVQGLVQENRAAMKQISEEYREDVKGLREDFNAARTQLGSIAEKALDSVADAHRALKSSS